MSVIHRKFKVSHSFEDISSLKGVKMNKEKSSFEQDIRESPEFEYLGLKWILQMHRDGSELCVGLKCASTKEAPYPSVSVVYSMRITSEKGYAISIDSEGEFSSYLSEKSKKILKWNQIFPNFDKIDVDCHMTIMKINYYNPRRLVNFDQSIKEFSDVRLILGGKTFYTCKLLLVRKSFYFSSLFLGDLSDSKKTEYEIKDVPADFFQEFLEIIDGELPMNDHNVEHILLHGDYFCSPLVTKRCEDYLLGRNNISENEKTRLGVTFRLWRLLKKNILATTSVDSIRSCLPVHLRELDPEMLAFIAECLFELHEKREEAERIRRQLEPPSPEYIPASPVYSPVN